LAKETIRYECSDACYKEKLQKELEHAQEIRELQEKAQAERQLQRDKMIKLER
jgi:hypothetical protein